MDRFVRIKTFTDRYPLVGPIFWIVTAQYYIAQLVAASAWHPHYSFTKNTISDLGNTACSMYSHRYVCSPDHTLMNTSFMILGITIMVGALLIWQEFRHSPWSFAGFGLMSVAGLGTALVGLAPENLHPGLHVVGAVMPFLLGNIALLLFGFSLGLQRLMKYYTLLSGAIALVALVFFAGHDYIGIGEGGMERMLSYPQTIWMMVFGLYMTRNHFKIIGRRHLNNSPNPKVN